MDFTKRNRIRDEKDFNKIAINNMGFISKEEALMQDRSDFRVCKIIYQKNNGETILIDEYVEINDIEKLENYFKERLIDYLREKKLKRILNDRK